MRHVQQLKLVEKFKSECTSKGYMQPVSSLGIIPNVANSTSKVRQRRMAVIRLVRSHDVSDNETINNGLNSIDDTGDEFDDRHFHAAATVPNEYLEAICGELTRRLVHIAS